MASYLVTGSTRGIGFELVRQLSEKLINNAGIVGWGRLEDMTDLEDTFRVNVTGPHIITQNFLPLLRKGSMKKIINISSSVGSIAKQSVYRDLPAPSYKITKAALNMMTVLYSQELEKEGFTVFCVSPGWLKTSEANSHADLPVGTGVERVLEMIRDRDVEVNGRFLNIHVAGWENNPGLNQYDGKELPW